jgi:hypothetical protein
MFIEKPALNSAISSFRSAMQMSEHVSLPKERNRAINISLLNGAKTMNSRHYRGEKESLRPSDLILMFGRLCTLRSLDQR